MRVNRSVLEKHIAEANTTLEKFGDILMKLETENPSLYEILSGVYGEFMEFVDFTHDLIIATDIRNRAKIAGAEKAEEVMDHLGIPKDWIEDEEDEEGDAPGMA